MYSTCEHPVNQPILRVLYSDHQGNEQFYEVRRNCSRIEATYKSGEYSNIPYVRVWDGATVLAEFCQHKLGGTWYEPIPMNPDKVHED